jgi:hypothetical protein
LCICACEYSGAFDNNTFSKAEREREIEASGVAIGDGALISGAVINLIYKKRDFPVTKHRKFDLIQ